MCVIGIDLGVKGAIAWVSDSAAEYYDLPVRVEKHGNAVDCQKTADVISSIMMTRPVKLVVVERLVGRLGGQQKGGIGIFSQGWSLCAGLTAVRLVGLDYCTILVMPTTWRADLGFSKSSKAQIKTACMEHAVLKKADPKRQDHADALWLGWYGHRLGTMAGWNIDVLKGR